MDVCRLWKCCVISEEISDERGVSDLKKVMTCKEALNNVSSHQVPKTGFFPTLLQFCHKLNILSQMHPEVVGSVH